MKKLIVFLLLIILSNIVFSQVQVTSVDLTGFVISAINNQPISGCYVSIKRSSRGEITDSVGKFLFNNLELNHDYVFSISAFGYDVFDTSIVLT
ncbi:MAG: carboxypeptidase-like regulatory domain-containing protein [Ignavibacteriales bacterium]|nr:MAG: carboxypeptidase-like regulatory domain-containing protein [Ignavibacteriales bacterium]